MQETKFLSLFSDYRENEEGSLYIEGIALFWGFLVLSALSADRHGKHMELSMRLWKAELGLKLALWG